MAPNGVWTKNPAAEKTATLQHYMADPEVRQQAWRNRARLAGVDGASRTPATGRSSSSSAQGKLHTLVTQNVDGLHQQAGTDPDPVVEIHGTMREVEVPELRRARARWSETLDRVRAGEEDPPCRTCGGILKSATISFGENLVPEDLDRADSVGRRSADLLLAVGTSLAVYPAADVVPIAKRNGARVVIVNAEPTPISTTSPTRCCAARSARSCPAVVRLRLTLAESPTRRGNV